ncbi:MAG: tRNA (N(6)-L-threonylcarbamoyladenosine(37)-C(2))-methylthiotransferase MtaB [Termitinemataceae bacterium]|nr:MAG: tRNA (N(6)-L-threonylcarbamoyladenosine(37)-C(2))-methylthiotransferase MtaB [Termitinemataceae bacterium]
MSGRTVVFKTVGCKLNISESEALQYEFIKNGWLVTQREDETTADLFIINTCTVTSKSEQKARRLIRLALKGNAVVIVSGCYAQLNKAEIEGIENDEQNCGGQMSVSDETKRLFVVGGRQKGIILSLPKYIAAEKEKGVPLNKIARNFFNETQSARNDPFVFDAQGFIFHSRAFLKIQDGCDNHCTYCRVHIARGKSVSLDAAAVLARLQKLEESGFSEVVLSGVNICQYNSGIHLQAHSQQVQMDLSALLEFLLAGTKKIAIRLSSLEPDFISDHFLKVCADKRIMPHFHICVQSFSNSVLKRMERKYTAAVAMDCIKSLRTIKDDPFIAADIICGFCGETDADFIETYAACKAIDFAWIHAFPFSKREGTAAFNFEDNVAQNIVKERVKKLSELAKFGKNGYIVRWIDKEIDAVVIDKDAAVSANYLKLAASGSIVLPQKGSAFRAKILGVADKQNADAFFVPICVRASVSA